MDLASQALGEASKRGLQGLYISDGRKFASRDIQSVLHHGRNLRTLKSFIPPKVMAAEVILSQWTCIWITTLTLRIDGIPRPDVLVDHLGKDIPAGTPLHSGTMSESRMVQRTVYAQLGTLVSLQELTLGTSCTVQNLIVDETGKQGPVYYDPLYQSNCLELSLESGLGLLFELKALRMLNVANMEQRIGEAELRWMSSCWHNFEQLEGLDSEDLYAPFFGMKDHN
ncbi:hypothetical protein BGX29_004032, partial [Mortierella sp. GBA35]